MQCVWDKLVIKCEELGKISYLTANWQRCSAALLLHRNITTLKKVGNKLSQVSCRWILLISADWFIVIARTGIQSVFVYKLNIIIFKPLRLCARLILTLPGTRLLGPHPWGPSNLGATPLRKHGSAWWLNFSPFGPSDKAQRGNMCPPSFGFTTCRRHYRVQVQCMVGGWLSRVEASAVWSLAGEISSLDMERHLSDGERAWANVWSWKIPTRYNWAHLNTHIGSRTHLWDSAPIWSFPRGEAAGRGTSIPPGPCLYAGVFPGGQNSYFPPCV